MLTPTSPYYFYPKTQSYISSPDFKSHTQSAHYHHHITPLPPYLGLNVLLVPILSNYFNKMREAFRREKQGYMA
jgi:hypothetical protein